MGRLIDCNDVYNAIQITTDNFGVAKHVVESNMLTMLSKIPTVEAIPKADYENRLKADIAKMLEEIKKEIIELPFPQREPEYMQGYSYCQMNILDYIIQQKIDALKGDQRCD